LSRSIHDTSTDLKRLDGRGYADAAHKAALSRDLKRRLRAKRQIKAMTLKQRRTAPLLVAADSADWVQVHAMGESCYVHYPASPKDVREVLRRLPHGATDGLESVDLRLGSEAQGRPERGEWEPWVQDPYTGRLGLELLPGVFLGRNWSDYNRLSHSIGLYAWVYPAGLPEPALWEPYFRLRMLYDLVHEVAHHFDHACRSQRGHQRRDQRGHPESYVSLTGARWSREVVLPYVREAYPDQVLALEDWVHRKAGTRLSIALLSGVLGLPEEDGGSSSMDPLFGLWYHFMRFATAVLKGSELANSRLELAWDLHFVKRYRAATEIVQAVLREYPDDPPALSMLADILADQDRLDEARSVALLATELAPDFQPAWDTLTNVLHGMEDWGPMLSAAQRATSLCYNREYARTLGLKDQITALVRLGRRKEAAALVTQLFRHRRMARYQPARERYRAQYAKLLDQCV
jgi:tetratricopeptide (TPR) repeat protein